MVVASSLLRLLIGTAIVVTGLSVGTDLNVVRELGGITLIVLVGGYALPRLFRGSSFADDDFFLRLALTAFALVSATQSITNIVDTEIPRFKLLLRLLYYVYLGFILSPLSNKVPRSLLSILTLLAFTSYPFHWMYIVGTAKSLPVLLMGLYTLVSVKVQFRDLIRDRWLRWGAAAVVFWILSNAVNSNFFQGFEGLMRLLAGISLFVAVRASRRDRWILLTIGLLAALHAVFFLAGLGAQAMFKQSIAAFWEKKQALAGINANDIAGYVVIVVPAILGCALDGPTKMIRRTALVVFGTMAVILGLTQARAAFPVFGAVTLITAYLMSGDNRVLRRTAFTLGAVAALAALVIGSGILISGSTETLTSVQSLRERLGLMSLAVAAVSQSPIAGVGYANTAALSAIPVSAMPFGLPSAVGAFYHNLGAGVHCHNLPLQLWLDGGLGYAVCILALIAWGAVSGLWTRIKGTSTSGQMVGAAGLAAIALQGVVNYHFIDYPTWFVFWSYLALSAGPLSRTDENRPVGNGFLVPVAVLFLATLVHGAVAFFYAQSVEALRGIRFVNAQNATVIVPKKDGKDRDRLAMAARNMRHATAVYPHDRFLLPVNAEILYHLVQLEGGKDFGQSRQAFEACAYSGLNPSFCLLRFSQILDPPDPKKSEWLQAEAARRDPFGLQSESILRPYY